MVRHSQEFEIYFFVFKGNLITLFFTIPVQMRAHQPESATISHGEACSVP